MGTWGAGSFENDDAADFLYEFESDGHAALFAAFAAAMGEGYLEASQGASAIAAAAIVGVAMGENKLGPADSSDLTTALAAHGKDVSGNLPELKRQARLALLRVRSEGSELKELWEENPEELPRWLENVKLLELTLA